MGFGADGVEPHAQYPIFDVTDWESVAPEPMGSKRKVWLEDPDGARWLFKTVRQAEDAQRGLRVFGEDWSEKTASALAGALGVPAARVELATRGEDRGSISRSVLPDEHHELEHGNELMQQLDPAYDIDQRREAAGYTVATVARVLQAYGPPPRVPSAISGAFAAFAGYLTFDALIANTDRHHANWAVIKPPDGSGWLAPSFDHATCLGFQEAPDRKERRLERGEVASWCERGDTHFEGRPSLVTAAVEALDLCSVSVRQHWRERLASLTDEHSTGIIAPVPDSLMSQVDRRFALEILRSNKARLLDAIPAR